MPAAPEFSLHDWVGDEARRREEFPVAARQVFLAHASIAALPARVAAALSAQVRDWSTGRRTYLDDLKDATAARALAADLLGARPDEIALLGPTSLGLSLVAAGIPWQPGDEVICYQDDYPANVYPWMDLVRRGVTVTFLRPEAPGRITPDLVAAALTPRTRLVALASCHFLTGYRIDVPAIGKLVHDAGALFCLDAIQTTGAFETRVDHVDFLAADSHKWLLGPCTAGIFYVAREHFDLLRPALLGSWNIRSPGFIAQGEIAFEDTARRYEPGVLNTPGIAGLKAALEMLLGFGIPAISDRILEVKDTLLARLGPLGLAPVGPVDDPAASGITTFESTRGGPDLEALFEKLERGGVLASLRHDRAGKPHLRFSPHFYNTAEEIDRVAELIGA